MKKFMFLHCGFEKPTPGIMEAWGKWFESIADKRATRAVSAVGEKSPRPEPKICHGAWSPSPATISSKPKTSTRRPRSTISKGWRRRRGSPTRLSSTSTFVTAQPAERNSTFGGVPRNRPLPSDTELKLALAYSLQLPIQTLGSLSFPCTDQTSKPSGLLAPGTRYR